MTLSHLAALGLGPEPTVENLAHEKTTRQSKYCPYIYIYIYILSLTLWVATMKENKGKGVASCTEGEEDV